MTDDRRASPRIAVDEQLSIRFEDLWILDKERIANISLDGMFISIAEPFPPGTVLSFSLDLGRGHRPVIGKAEVRWIREAPMGPDDPAGMGVQFVELDEESVATIKQLAASAELD